MVPGPALACSSRTASASARCAALLLAVAAVAALVAHGAALTGGSGARAPQQLAGSPEQGRVVDVARAVQHWGYPMAKYREELKTKSNEELHVIIAEARKHALRHRLEVWRKKTPPRAKKYEMGYKIAVAKTLMQQRLGEEMQKAAEGAEPEEEPKYTDLVAATLNSETAEKMWHMRPAIGHFKRFPPSRVAGEARLRRIPYYKLAAPSGEADGGAATPAAAVPLERKPRSSAPSLLAGGLGLGLATVVAAAARRRRRSGLA